MYIIIILYILILLDFTKYGSIHAGVIKESAYRNVCAPTQAPRMQVDQVQGDWSKQLEQKIKKLEQI